MSVISLSDRRITLKLVYYGPASGGKTTSLQYVHRVLDPEGEGKLVTLSTAGDSTLFFDFLPIDLGKIGGFDLRVQGYTVPGQIRYARTRRFVLQGADAVVFVATSDPAGAAENEESVRDFAENLRANGIDPDRCPLVFQYNKRDLPGAEPLAAMGRTVRFRPAPEFESVAIRGEGVLEAFSEALSRAVAEVARDAGQDPAAAVAETSRRLAALHREALRVAPPAAEPPGPGPSFPPDPPGGVADENDLLEKAISSGVELSRLYADVNLAKSRLEAAASQSQALNRLSRRLLASASADGVWEELYRACREEVPATAASLLVRDRDSGGIAATHREGGGPDPLLATHGAERTVAFLRHLGEAAHVREEDAPDLVGELRRAEPGLHALLVVPVQIRGDVEGGVVLYRDAALPPFHIRETRLLSSAANLASLALGRALREQEFVSLNRELEERVRDRTERLSTALKTIRRMNATLEDRVRARTADLERANETLRRTQDFLLQAEKMSSLARMASGIAHEINNPMAFVRGNLKTLRSYGAELESALRRVERAAAAKGDAAALRAAVREALADPSLAEVRADLPELLEETAEGAQRVVKIAEGMRNLAYLKTTEKVEVDLVAQIENALTVLAHRLKMGVEVVRDYGPLPPLSGHPVLLGQLFLNLCVNAVDAMDEEGRLSIRTFTEGGRAVVEIADTGPGIPAEVRPHIFEPFYTTKEVGKGTGLGLYTVYQIVERHGGVVTVENRPGGGAVFRIELLAAEATASAI